MEPAVGLEDPCGFFPTQDVLWVYSCKCRLERWQLFGCKIWIYSVRKGKSSSCPTHLHTQPIKFVKYQVFTRYFSFFLFGCECTQLYPVTGAADPQAVFYWLLNTQTLKGNVQGLLAATVSASHFATIVEGTYCSVVERLMSIMSVSGILENGFLNRIETHFSFFFW